MPMHQHPRAPSILPACTAKHATATRQPGDEAPCFSMDGLRRPSLWRVFARHFAHHLAHQFAQHQAQLLGAHRLVQQLEF